MNIWHRCAIPFIMCLTFFFFLFFNSFFLPSSSEHFTSSISKGGGVRWEGYSPLVCQRAVLPRRWRMLADSETMPGDPAANGTSNREPFIIGVAGGTASGKVGIRNAALHVDCHCLSTCAHMWTHTIALISFSWRTMQRWEEQRIIGIAPPPTHTIN